MELIPVKDKTPAELAAERAEAERKAREEREARIAAEAAAEATRAAEAKAARVAAEHQRKEQEARAQAERERVEQGGMDGVGGGITEALAVQQPQGGLSLRGGELHWGWRTRGRLRARGRVAYLAPIEGGACHPQARNEYEAREQASEQAAIAKREANKQHRENIHVEIIDELLSIPGMNADLAWRVAASLAAGIIPHCSIQY